MELKEYLFRNNLTIQALADRMHYTRTRLSLLVHGHIKPSKKIALLVEKETEGKVTLKDLVKTYNNRQKTKEQALLKENEGIFPMKQNGYKSYENESLPSR
jgi:plasmid maintenance system antidote protein VapI